VRDRAESATPVFALRDVSDEDATAECGDGLSRQGEKSKNVTNKANFDATVIIIQTEDSIAVAANSGVDSGLDKGQRKTALRYHNDSKKRTAIPK
jgi:hypothetical protein